jgi:iron-regulated transporter 1
VVYRKFPVLSSPTSNTTPSGTRNSGSGVLNWVKREKEDWAEFTRLPIFFSQYRSLLVYSSEADDQGSIAIAAIYLTTLSYGQYHP